MNGVQWLGSKQRIKHGDAELEATDHYHQVAKKELNGCASFGVATGRGGHPSPEGVEAIQALTAHNLVMPSTLPDPGSDWLMSGSQPGLSGGLAGTRPRSGKSCAQAWLAFAQVDTTLRPWEEGSHVDIEAVVGLHLSHTSSPHLNHEAHA